MSTRINIAILACLTLCCCGPDGLSLDSRALHIREGRLHQGDDPFILRAMELPGGVPPVDGLTGAMGQTHEWAAQGIDSVCVSLADAATLKPDALLDTVKAFLAETNWRKQGAIIHLRCGGPESFTPAQVGALAKGLRSNRDAIYWIEGPEAAAAIKLFHRKAPKLLILAAEGGDLKTSPMDSQDPLTVTASTPTDTALATANFIAPMDPALLDRLDSALATSAEKNPWAPQSTSLGPAEQAEGWLALFDGNTLDGWMSTGAANAWAVRDGCIERVGDDGGMLRTTARYDRFMLRLSWKIGRDANSGVSLHMPRSARASKIGIEFQIMGDSGLPPDKTSTGSIYDVTPPLVNAARPEGEWNETEITFDWPRFRAVLNGQLIQDVDMSANPELAIRLQTGFIGLQDHGAAVAFRDILIKPLTGL